MVFLAAKKLSNKTLFTAKETAMHQQGSKYQAYGSDRKASGRIIGR